MLPGTAYFKSIDCPFFLSGLCERPYCHFLHRQPRPSFSPEPAPSLPNPELTLPPPTPPTPQVDAKGHRLYLPPPNAPVYNPTPKALLAAEKKQTTPKPYIPSSLAKVAALHKPPTTSHPVKPKEVLGDIGDLSSSDEEEKNPDVIGSILLQGVKSGVLGGQVSEFQHELIKNTYKVKKKAEPVAKEPEDDEKKIVIVISDDEESLKEAQRKKEVEEEERKKRVLEEERLEAKRLLEEKEKELEELEKKRKVLENFYKKTNSQESKDSTSNEKEPRHERKKSKHKSRKRKHSRRKHSKKKSKRRRSSSSSSSYSSSSLSSSESSSSYSSSSDESDSETERRRHHKKRSRRKKSKRHHHHKDKKSSSLKREKIKEEPCVITIKSEKGVDDEPERILLPSEIKKEKNLDVDVIVKKEPVDEAMETSKMEVIPTPSQIKDEDLPESVKSFLDAMEEIDMKMEQKESSAQQHSSSVDKKHRSSSNSDSRKSSSSTSRKSSSDSSKKSSSRDRHSSSRSDDRKKSYSKSSSSKESSSSSKSSSKESSSSSKSLSFKESTSSSKSSSVKESSSSSKLSKSSSRSSKPSNEAKSGDPSPGSSSMVDRNSVHEEELDMEMEPAIEEDYFESSGPEDAFENEDEELRRIFEEHERQVRQEVPSLPKRKAVPAVPESSQKKAKEEESVNPKSKKRVAHKADTDSSMPRPPSVRRPISATQQMLERYKKIQSMRENVEMENRLASLDGDDEVPKSKMKALSLNKSNRVLSVPKRTVATTTKGVARISHVPTVDISKPLIAPDMNSKVPSGIRQRYLDSIVEECLKIYGGNKGDAYARASKEEQICCDRSKNRNIYLNVVVNCIKKLRAEASSAPKSKQSSIHSARNMVTSHLQVLAGKGGSKGSWSIEKNKSNIDENSPGLAYAILKRYVLSKEDLIENGYPMMDPDTKGRAYIVPNAQYSNRNPQPAESYKRRCDRCSSIYKVDLKGKQSEPGECVYHWGRLYRQKSNRALGPTSGYYCCNGDTNSEGCEVSQVHVTEMEDYNNMRGFVAAFSASQEASDGNYGVYALDCEMCHTTHGNELTRVTVINYEGSTVYESLVKPSREVIDYNTRFSGITQKDLEDVSTTILDVQAVLLSMFSSETILIGHSLESDLKALKMVHSMVVDTSIVFPHKMGPPYKRALRHLAAEHLKRIIQNDVGGHDSAEDALAALDLMKVKVKSDVKKLQQDSLKQK